MEKLLRFESHLIRVESWLLVGMVLTMLLLGSYNVLYRNVLVAWQKSLATSGPPVVPAAPAAAPATPTPDSGGSGGFGGFGSAGTEDKAGAAGFGGGFGSDDDAAEPGDGADGFGGGFGESDDEPDGVGGEPAADPANAKPAGGFGGGFGDDDDAPAGEETPANEPPAAKAPPAVQDPPPAAGGFGGGFGDDDGADEGSADGADEGADNGDGGEGAADDADGFGGGFGAADDDGDDDGGGFGGGFGDEPEVPRAEAPKTAYQNPAPTEPEGGPPPEGSFAAGMVSLIDTIKLDWIDTLLRQLVIMVGFFGAMIATQRRKHINIDAASKLLPAKARGWIAMGMNVLATVMSGMLAVAGWKLVAISQAFPKEIMPHMQEWHMQLMFPVGFGMLGVHFLFRTIEDLDRNLKGLPPIAGGETGDLEKEKAERQAAAQETA